MSDLQPPIIYNGTSVVELPHPSSWSVNLGVKKASNTSLGGVDMSDTLFRKYQYTLTWDAMWTTDYDEMVALITTQYTEGETISFTYGKFPGVSGVDVIVDLGDRGFVAGQGTDYYSSVSLVLTEVNPR